MKNNYLMSFNSISEKFIFYYLPISLFSLIPLFLITGPFLSDLSISLISILFFFYCLKKKNFSFFKNKFFYFFLIFWIYLLINSLFNNYNYESFSSSLVYIRHGVFVMAVVTLLNNDETFIKYFFYCIFICFALLILDGFYQYFVGQNMFGWENSYRRTSSFFGEEKILGSYISRLWPIFIGLCILVIKQKNKIFYFSILVIILSYVLVFLSGERSAFFNINLSALFLIIFSLKYLRLRLFSLLFSIVILAIISFINPTAKERVFDQTFNHMIVEANELGEIYIFSKQHTHQYITSYKMFLDNKLLGVGIKNFRNFCNNKKYKISNLSCSTHPHNTYIQILTETGIIGFSFLLIALFYFCKYIFYHLTHKFKGKYYFTDFEICVLSGIAIYLWPFLPTGNVFNNWLSIAMFINIPFLIWSRNSKKINNLNN